ncbi:unnamed protein product [Dicrocoelium dendriticum]|nr:unnamed protein product [Dicrocoelium dendriticum]CAH8491488.1 unnamed protein product [Dicrocoelium dendriticum]
MGLNCSPMFCNYADSVEYEVEDVDETEAAELDPSQATGQINKGDRKQSNESRTNLQGDEEAANCEEGGGNEEQENESCEHRKQSTQGLTIQQAKEEEAKPDVGIDEEQTVDSSDNRDS